MHLISPLGRQSSSLLWNTQPRQRFIWLSQYIRILYSRWYIIRFRMISGHGNNFHINGLFSGINRPTVAQRASNAELICFICCKHKSFWTNNQVAIAFRRHNTNLVSLLCTYVTFKHILKNLTLTHLSLKSFKPTSISDESVFPINDIWYFKEQIIKSHLHVKQYCGGKLW